MKNVEACEVVLGIADEDVVVDAKTQGHHAEQYDRGLPLAKPIAPSFWQLANDQLRRARSGISRL